jgi:enoyl-CoA hydratase
VAVDLVREGAIATVTMNRPEALNAFDEAQLRATVDVFRQLHDDREVRCVILTGAGERAFAAGADIKRMQTMTRDEAVAFGRLGQAVTIAIEALPQPVIASVNGFAFGGGCEVALACDIRLASEQAVFAQPEVGLGIPPGWGGSQRLPRLVGAGLAAELIFSGRRVDAAEALRIGLVNAVHPSARLLPEANGLAEKIASNSPRAVRAAKSALAVAFGDTAKGLKVELELFVAGFGKPDQVEGMTAFVEKRKPNFTGE